MKKGIMEEWNIGMMGKKLSTYIHHSIMPVH